VGVRCDHGFIMGPTAWAWSGQHGSGGGKRWLLASSAAGITPDFKVKLNAHSMCAQESSLHTYRTKNGYRITNVTI
jgi:hypothetical protein